MNEWHVHVHVHVRVMRSGFVIDAMGCLALCTYMLSLRCCIFALECIVA